MKNKENDPSPEEFMQQKLLKKLQELPALTKNLQDTVIVSIIENISDAICSLQDSLTAKDINTNKNINIDKTALVAVTLEKLLEGKISSIDAFLNQAPLSKDIKTNLHAVYESFHYQAGKPPPYFTLIKTGITESYHGAYIRALYTNIIGTILDDTKIQTTEANINAAKEAISKLPVDSTWENNENSSAALRGAANHANLVIAQELADEEGGEQVFPIMQVVPRHPEEQALEDLGLSEEQQLALAMEESTKLVDNGNIEEKDYDLEFAQALAMSMQDQAHVEPIAQPLGPVVVNNNLGNNDVDPDFDQAVRDSIHQTLVIYKDAYSTASDASLDLLSNLLLERSEKNWNKDEFATHLSAHNFEGNDYLMLLLGITEIN